VWYDEDISSNGRLMNEDDLVNKISQENDRLSLFAKHMDERMSKLEDILEVVASRVSEKNIDDKVSEEVLKEVDYMSPSRKRSDLDQILTPVMKRTLGMSDASFGHFRTKEVEEAYLRLGIPGIMLFK
jgi:chromosomal replication initiation ATPase DnaA